MIENMFGAGVEENGEAISPGSFLCAGDWGESRDMDYDPMFDNEVCRDWDESCEDEEHEDDVKTELEVAVDGIDMDWGDSPDDINEQDEGGTPLQRLLKEIQEQHEAAEAAAKQAEEDAAEM